MRAKDIPEFIFRGAIVDVDGREETVKEFSLQTPLINGRPARSGQCLYLEFKSGAKMEYDARHVREIPGMVPEFLREGAHIFCKDPPSKNKNEDRFRKAGNGEWEIVRVVPDKDEDDGQQRLRLLLKRPWVSGSWVVSRHFNSRTMTPIPSGQGTSAPETPVYELQNDIRVNKPIVLRPRG